jgi:hypothetical protein
MSEEDVPPVPSDDSPTIALQEQWAAERKRLQELVSWTVTRPRFDPGKVPDPEIVTGVTFTSVADPGDLLPTLLMQTLVTRGGSTNDGILIQSVAAPWREILKIIKDDPDAIYQIDPWKWEEIIAGSYQASGLFDEVVLTPRSTWEFAPRIEDDPNIKSLLPHRIELVNRDALIKRFAAWGPPD